MTKDDGYCGNWGDGLHSETNRFMGAFPLPLPPDKRTTLVVTQHKGRWLWRCASCGEVIETAVMARPGHICKKEVA